MGQLIVDDLEAVVAEVCGRSRTPTAASSWFSFSREPSVAPTAARAFVAEFDLPVATGSAAAEVVEFEQPPRAMALEVPDDLIGVKGRDAFCSSPGVPKETS